MEEGTSKTASMANVGTSGPPLSEVGQEGFPGETTWASMARGPVLFRVLVFRGIRDREVLPDPTWSSHSA